jgi:hypothetical protein
MSFLALLAVDLHGFLLVIKEAPGVVTAEVISGVFRRQFGVSVVRRHCLHRRAGAIKYNLH